jgi:hypothetical protein
MTYGGIGMCLTRERCITWPMRVKWCRAWFLCGTVIKKSCLTIQLSYTRIIRTTSAYSGKPNKNILRKTHYTVGFGCDRTSGRCICVDRYGTRRLHMALLLFKMATLYFRVSIRALTELSEKLWMTRDSCSIDPGADDSPRSSDSASRPHADDRALWRMTSNVLGNSRMSKSIYATWINHLSLARYPA